MSLLEQCVSLGDRVSGEGLQVNAMFAGKLLYRCVLLEIGLGFVRDVVVQAENELARIVDLGGSQRLVLEQHRGCIIVRHAFGWLSSQRVS